MGDFRFLAPILLHVFINTSTAGARFNSRGGDNGVALRACQTQWVQVCEQTHGIPEPFTSHGSPVHRIFFSAFCFPGPHFLRVVSSLQWSTAEFSRATRTRGIWRHDALPPAAGCVFSDERSGKESPQRGWSRERETRLRKHGLTPHQYRFCILSLQ